MLLLYITNVQIFTEKRFLYNFVTTQKNRHVPCSFLMAELKKTGSLPMQQLALLIFSTRILSLFFCIYIKVLSYRVLIATRACKFDWNNVWAYEGSKYWSFYYDICEGSRRMQKQFQLWKLKFCKLDRACKKGSTEEMFELSRLRVLYRKNRAKRYVP